MYKALNCEEKINKMNKKEFDIDTPANVIAEIIANKLLAKVESYLFIREQEPPYE